MPAGIRDTGTINHVIVYNLSRLTALHDEIARLRQQAAVVDDDVLARGREREA